MELVWMELESGLLLRRETGPYQYFSTLKAFKAYCHHTFRLDGKPEDYLLGFYNYATSKWQEPPFGQNGQWPKGSGPWTFMIFLGDKPLFEVSCQKSHKIPWFRKSAYFPH
jgi:hypothetical protein